MFERDIMEKNLAELVLKSEAHNYQSSNGSVEEDPVNPFQKRVFEKKLRRSSVASQNKHPNIIKHTSAISCDINEEYKQEIDNIFTDSQVEFQKIRRRIINHVEGMEGLEKYEKMKIVMDNLKKNMKYVHEYMENNALGNFGERKQSTFELETYECNDKSIDSIEGEEQKNYYFERYESVKGRQNRKQKAVRRKERNLTGSMVGNSKKSIYESVLEERKLRKSKKRIL